VCSSVGTRSVELGVQALARNYTKCIVKTRGGGVEEEEEEKTNKIGRGRR
jgi:hypothetical protein